MTTKYNAYYDFNFDTVVSKLYEKQFKQIDSEIDTTSTIMKTKTESIPVGPEKFKASTPFRDAINKLKKEKDLIKLNFISEYESIRADIIYSIETFKSKSTDLNILLQYIEYIKTNILPRVYTLLKLDDDGIKKFEIIKTLTIDQLEKLGTNISSANMHTPDIIIYHYDELISIFILHIKKMIYTMCVIYNRIFVNKEADVYFVLLFCQGDYTTLFYKQGNKKGHEYLKSFIDGIIPGVKNNNDKQKMIIKTKNSIELSYDIANTALPMFTSLEDLSIFIDSIGRKIHRICIIGCLNYTTYNYTYQKNNKFVKVDKTNFIEYIDNIYITPIIPLLTDNGELFIYGGDANNILEDRFNSVFTNVINSTINGIQLAIYKRFIKTNTLNGGSIKYKTNKRIPITLNCKSTSLFAFGLKPKSKKRTKKAKN